MQWNESIHALAGQHSNFRYGNKSDYLLEKKDDDIFIWRKNLENTFRKNKNLKN
jgi:hypothetical protein